MKKINPSFMTVLVLVIIALCSGAILAVVNDVCYVSEEEKNNRALAKVYESKSFTTKEINTEFAGRPCADDSANTDTIKGVWQAEDGTYVLKARGNGGYSNGWVEVMVALSADPENAKNILIKNVALSDNEGQSFIGNVNAAFLAQFKKSLADDFMLNKESTGEGTYIDPVSGTSKSSRAIKNAVNIALYYARNALGLGENPEADGLKAVLQLDAAYASFTMASTPIYALYQQNETVKLNYVYVSSVAEQQNYVGFVFAAGNETIAVMAAKDTASVLQAKVFANGALTGDPSAENKAVIDAQVAVYAKLLKNPASASIKSVEKATEGEKATYTVITRQGVYGMDPSITVKVVVEKGTVTSVEYLSQIWQGAEIFGDKAVKAEAFVGKTITTLEQMQIGSEGFGAGATNTSHNIYDAVRFCLYDQQGGAN